MCTCSALLVHACCTPVYAYVSSVAILAILKLSERTLASVHTPAFCACSALARSGAAFAFAMSDPLTGNTRARVRLRPRHDRSRSPRMCPHDDGRELINEPVTISAAESVAKYPTPATHILTRSSIQAFADAPRFGERLCRFPFTVNAQVYDYVAQHACRRTLPKHSDIVTHQWRVLTHHAFHCAVNLAPLQDRFSFVCVGTVYDLRAAPNNALVVIFTHKLVGGGCFRSGLRPQEQLFMQSQDLAVRLHLSRPFLDWNEGVTFAGVHFDAWWSKDTAAAMGTSLRFSDILPADTGPMTVLALDAPPLRLAYGYDRASLSALVCKVLLVYATAVKFDSPVIYTGLIGAEAVHNNRPLILLLHLLLEPPGNTRPIIFHHPVLRAHGSSSPTLHERTILRRAITFLAALRAARVRYVHDALEHILAWQLPTSWQDRDLDEGHTQRAGS